MNWEKSHLIKVLAALIICSPAAWSQVSTDIKGDAAACVDKKYEKAGTTAIRDGASTSCKRAGAASASSKANVGSGGFDVGAGAMGTTIKAGANGFAFATDTVTLIPPADFNGSFVDVVLIDTYSFVIKGASSKHRASAEICWVIPKLLDLCLDQTTNGESAQGLKKKLTIQKADFTFPLTIGGVVAARGASAAVTDILFHFELPGGWSCTYASGGRCY